MATVLYNIFNLKALDSTKSAAVLIFILVMAGLLILQRFTRKMFKEKQMEYERVKLAYKEKNKLLKDIFTSKNVKYPPKSIFIRVFKEEGILELWSSSKDKPYTLVKSYPVSKSSGVLGPKRKEGDKQVPEGFYFIDYFNPLSKYYLSLSINYPNESDMILGYRENPGGDIFIHGGSSTIGCIPINDDGIKELYIAAVEAVSQGQDRIEVHIFPKIMDDIGFRELQERHKDDAELLYFWENIKAGYDAFESTKTLPVINIGRDGRYIINIKKL
ncbi:hypothetical protein OXPF_12620 [Oxobacter pfennigii]|uniref:L,D-TPase catalytic domain-containing protein n=1 Tax=Oxobacter pfennigii TaxID=36849 RepID=A0A0P8YD32_9CLOT|nr:L,D-transpeptidase family protein [Oxobacter pfennigii]KPU45135.1 hypothetical protein OXPF_12620 [Oxobacter pfennigii]